jgi:3-oxoacyl-(acyl-carrier-protein) synthase
MNQVFVNATGIVTSKGVGTDAHADIWATGSSPAAAESFQLNSFKPAPYLSDRRMLKAVSDSDAIGIVAIEDLKKTNAAFMSADPFQNGLYVGSPPGSAHDNQFYFDAMKAVPALHPEGAEGSIRDFGATCMTSKPTTLLIGLPNNVLCYGSIILGVKGPNSNYTSTFLSGHIALQTAARKVRRGQVEAAVAGGFAMHSEPVNSSMYEQQGVATRDKTKAERDDMIPIADGAVFVGLSSRRNADDGCPAVEFIDGALANDALGPRTFDPYGVAFEKLISDLLGRNSVSKESVGLLLANSSGLGQLDASEKSVLSRVYANERVLPALGCSRKILGNLMEAGGLFELELARHIYASGKVPTCMQLPEYNAGDIRYGSDVSKDRPYALVLRASPWGEYSAVLVKVQ